MIEERDLVDGQVYEVTSRNLTVGVWHASARGFIGIRQKFNARYLFEEYHWDTGPPFGTARAVREIEGLTAAGYDLDKLERELPQTDILFVTLNAIDREINRYLMLDHRMTSEYAVQYWDLTERGGKPKLVEDQCGSARAAHTVADQRSRRAIDERHFDPKPVTRRVTEWVELPPEE